MDKMQHFRALGLSETTLCSLEKKGWETPSPIQEKTIPLLLKDEKDVVGQAQTGTGKTGAFGLPLIEKLDDKSTKTQALILCPTRELANQVAEEIQSFRGDKKLFVQAVYGGASYSTQERALRKGVQIVVGTPGRIRDHIERKTLKLDSLTHVVLDEADEMLNMGFEEEVRDILKFAPQQKRMLLFSATMPAPILKLAKTFMGDYEMVAVEKQKLTTELIDQIYFEVRESDRFEALCRIIDTEPEFYGIVFCKTKIETDQIADRLIDRGYDAEGIHGDVTQSQRELILKKFKLRKVNILVATDVAARGIDVNDLTHVVNYQLPQDPEVYVHRIGRTGRAGKNGTAITIIAPAEFKQLMFVQKVAKTQLRKDSVPSVHDVIQTKLMKLKTEMTSIIERNDSTAYNELAAELLEDNRNPADVIAALLEYSMKDTLKESAYHEITEVKKRMEQGNNNMVRLFVAKGHMDHMNAGQVAQFLAREAGVNAEDIQDIRVLEKFTFVSVPAQVAEQILVVFERNSKGRRSLVTRAKEKAGTDKGEGSKREFRKGGGFSSKKTFEPRQQKQRTFEPKHEKTESDKPRRRQNKLTDYLDKKPAPASPQKTTEKKPLKKKGDTSEVDRFMSKFDDDLSW